MREKALSFISQKIKSFKVFITGLFAKLGLKKAELGAFSGDKKQEPLSIKPEETRRNPIDDSTAKYALQYIFEIVNTAGCDRGVGIIIEDVDKLRERNSFIDIVCLSFRYVTIYTENIESANLFGDFVYEKYGLPIMVLNISEAARCRYPVIIDLMRGKVRYGRDLCIEGAEFDNNGKFLGLCVGSRTVPIPR